MLILLFIDNSLYLMFFLFLQILLVLQTTCTKEISIEVLNNNVPLMYISDFCNFDSQISLMLDTGSSELWLADNQCSNCPKTQMLCPQLSNIQKNINYAVGSVYGAQSFINICGLRSKFLCILQAQQIDSYRANGILGISGNSTGINFLRNLLLLHNQKPIINFYYGKKEKKLIIGADVKDYIKGNYIVFQQPAKDNLWKMNVSSVLFGSDIIQQKDITIHLDTGSSVLLFPKDLFDKILDILKLKISSSCYQRNEGIICPDPGKQLQYLKTIQIQFTYEQQRIIRIFHQSLYYWNNKNLLIFPIKSTKDKQILLGTPFFQHNLCQFDLQNMTFTILQTNREQLDKYEHKNSFIAFLLMILIVMGLSYTIWTSMQIVQRRRQNKIII